MRACVHISKGCWDSLKPFDAEKFNEKVLREFENLIE